MKVTPAAKKYLAAELDDLSDRDIRRVVEAVQALVDHGLLDDGDEPDEGQETDRYIAERGRQRVANGAARPAAYAPQESE